MIKLKVRVVLILLSFMLISCSNSNKQDQSKDDQTPNMQSFTDTSSVNTGNEIERVPLFHLGMDIEEVRAILEENNIEIINEIENTGDSDTWDWGNKSIWTEGISFTFDQDYILYDLEFDNDEPTLEGIMVGDDLDLLLNKYGNQFKLYGPEELMNMWIIDESQDKKAEIYEYRMDDHYFRAFVIDNKIVSWNISKYKLGTNSPVTEDYSEVAQKLENPIKAELLAEFKHYMKQIRSGDNSKYNQIIASDRARGLLSLDEIGLFKLDYSELDQVYEAAEALRDNLNDSVVYTGYSLSGGHIIAILSPLNYENEAYYEAINQITNQKDEHEFLNYITEQSDWRTLEVGLDISVENFADQNEEFILNEIVITNADGDNAAPADSGEHVSNAMQKYNRTNKMVNNKMKSGEWYTFSFDGTLIFDPTITIHLNDEQIVLTKQ